ncbi:MAG: PD-(D/E)XK nuclease family protein [Paludibacteraceae bacterium]|nr:PD-(D/E)XK nuclease family protein [Paludibacteraceae bacterium]
MKFEQIPNIEKAWENVSIETLSPSTFSWVHDGCAYQVLLQRLLNAYPSCQLPSHRNTTIGTIVHKIYELTTKGRLQNFAEMRDKWEEMIKAEEDKLAIKYPTLKSINLNDYDKRNKAIKYALGIIKNRNTKTVEPSNVSVLSEKFLDCKEIGLKGVADKLVIKNGKVTIIDYKSGQIFDNEGNVKKEYVTQLHLYAAMCEHLNIGNINKLALVDINGEEILVDYNNELKDKLCNDVASTIGQLNDLIQRKAFVEVVKADRSKCGNCSCRHICQYHLENEEDYYHTIKGIVSEQPSTNMYVVTGDNGICRYISGLDEYSIDNVHEYLNKQLVFINVTKSSPNSEDSAYKVCDCTIIFEQL